MKKIILIPFLLLNLFIASVWAQGFVVQRIEVQGLQRLTPQTVYSYLPIKPGQTLNPNKTGDIISALYHTGFFEHISIDRSGNTLIIHVQERCTIGMLKITGNSYIATDKLTTVMKSMDIAEGRVYNAAMIERIRQSLLNQYYELGRYNARVDVVATPMERGRMCVKIIISEGLVAKIRRINIIGNHAFSERQLAKQMTVSTPGLFTFITMKDRYSQEKMDESLDNLRNFYLDHGYIKFSVKSTQVAITPDRKSIYLTVVIDEGLLFTIKGVALEGDLILPRECLMKLIKIKEGDVFSRKCIIAGEKAISDALGDKGYIGAALSLVPQVDEKCRQVFITILIKPGKQAYVRHVFFTDNAKTNDEVLRREVVQMESSVVSSKRLLESKQRLSLLPYIRDVQMAVVPIEGEDDQVDVNYKVTEDNAAQANFNVGYSQKDGILFGAGINQKNFLGTGKTVGFNLTRSRYQQYYGINFTDPYYTPDGISRSINLAASTFNPGRTNITSSYTADQFDLSVLYGIPIGQQRGVFNRLQLGYGYEHTKINLSNNVSTQVMNFISQHGRQYDQIDLVAGLSRDSRDRAIFPTCGGIQTVGLNIYLPAKNGGISYFTTSYTGRWYYPFSDRFIGIARSQVGYGKGLHNQNDFPFFKNFYAGGIDSVRGYLGNSLGPRDSRDQAMGGNFLVAGSLGMVFPNYISDNFRTNVFVDGGNVYNTRSVAVGGSASGSPRFSTGIEGTWLSPLGLIDVSLAKPLNRRKGGAGRGDEEEIFQFSLGANFG